MGHRFINAPYIMQISSEDFSTHLQHCHFFFNFFLSFVKQRCRIDPIIARNQPMQIIPHSALVYANYPHPLQRCHIRSIQTRTPPPPNDSVATFQINHPLNQRRKQRGGERGVNRELSHSVARAHRQRNPPPPPLAAGSATISPSNRNRRWNLFAWFNGRWRGALHRCHVNRRPFSETSNKILIVLNQIVI